MNLISSDLMYKRALFLIAVLGAALLVCLITFRNLALGEARNDLLLQADKIALRHGYIAPSRGKIITADNIVLAWSERLYNLILLPGVSEKQLENAQKKLKEINIECLPNTTETAIPVKRKLSIDDLNALAEIVPQYPFLQIDLQIERQTLDDSTWSCKIGSVMTSEQNQLLGIDGLEKKYDLQLKGTPGYFTVLLDSRGNWINSTLNLIYDPQSGKDITLPYTLTTLINSENLEL